MNIVLTGATGFIGSTLLPALSQHHQRRLIARAEVGNSQYEAEQGLSTQIGMEIVLIRPSLVYGAGVKGNFLSMMRWLHKGIPLPFGAVHNQRSLVAFDNLINLITVYIKHPAAANQTFLVGDGGDLSITELLQRLSAALGRPASVYSQSYPGCERRYIYWGKKIFLCGCLVLCR